MKKEIRKDIREYILSEVRTTLMRLGVTEDIKETHESINRYEDLLYYNFKSTPIRQMPMLFKELYVDGYMTSIEIKSDKDIYFGWTDENDIIVVIIEYSWKSFTRGTNGTEIGRMIFAVSKNLPKSFDTENETLKEDRMRGYVYKLEGLNI